MIHDYEKQVYAAILGKVIGVYLGRPFEGWPKEKIMARLGVIDRYVNHELDMPLVVSDDDISGTFTFVRALADSGKFAHTEAFDVGNAWLNYLIEYKTILWWAGRSLSTEHTAYLNLKNGIPAPESGSMHRNGKAVAEQIGAQIFIEGFALVAPGNVPLAVKLARAAASVSHDGEAVYAAMAVAAMVSAAFVEKSMEKLLDTALSVIPQDCLIAEVHRHVREWSKHDNDWHRTYERIKARYGYQIYGGNCHVIPNHALMVMAWSYAQDNFFEAMTIVNSCGWDTDCNAANVGTVSALVCGVEHLCDGYDYRTPFADRILLPTAEGTFSVTDCALIAGEIAAMGRKVMGYPALERPKHGAWLHFTYPGSVHGFMTEDGEVKVSQQHHHLVIAAQGPGRVSTLVSPGSGNFGWYNVVAVPRLSPGALVTVRVKAEAACKLTMFARLDNKTVLLDTAHELTQNYATLTWRIPNVADAVITDFGFLFNDAATVWVDSVAFNGDFAVNFANLRKNQPGWIDNIDGFWSRFSDDNENFSHLIANDGDRLMVTGTRDWRNYTAACRFDIHAARRGGMVVRYQGLERYYLAVFEAGMLRLLKRHYGVETLLAEVEFLLPDDQPCALAVECVNDAFTVSVDGVKLLCAKDDTYADGGAGFLAGCGMIGVREIAMMSK